MMPRRALARALFVHPQTRRIRRAPKAFNQTRTYFTRRALRGHGPISSARSCSSCFCSCFPLSASASACAASAPRFFLHTRPHTQVNARSHVSVPRLPKVRMPTIPYPHCQHHFGSPSINLHFPHLIQRSRHLHSSPPPPDAEDPERASHGTEKVDAEGHPRSPLPPVPTVAPHVTPPVPPSPHIKMSTKLPFTPRFLFNALGLKDFSSMEIMDRFDKMKIDPLSNSIGVQDLLPVFRCAYAEQVGHAHTQPTGQGGDDSGGRRATSGSGKGENPEQGSSDVPEDVVAKALCCLGADENGRISPAAFQLSILQLAEQVDNRAYPIALASFLTGCALGVVSPLFPLFAKDLGISISDFGLIIAALGFARLIMNVPITFGCDRYGRRPFLIWGPAANAVSMVWTGLATSFSSLFTARLLTGAGGGSQLAGAQMYLSDICTPLNRARTFAPLMAAFSAGAALGPAMGGLFSDMYGVPATFGMVGCALAGVTVLSAWTLPETRVFDSTMNRETLREAMQRTLRQYLSMLKVDDIRNITLLNFLYWTCVSGCQFTLLPILITENLGVGAATVGGLYAMISVINMVGSAPAGWLADKFGRKKTIVPGGLLVSLSLCLVPMASTVPEMAALMALWATGSTIVGQTPLAYVNDVSTPDQRGPAMAMLRSASDAGLLCGAGTAGWLAGWHSLALAFDVSAGVLGLGLVVFAMRARETLVAYRE